MLTEKVGYENTQLNEQLLEMTNHLYSTLQTAHCRIKEKLDVLLEVLSVNKKMGPPLSYLVRAEPKGRQGKV